jgi:hypothetical protein
VAGLYRNFWFICQKFDEFEHVFAVRAMMGYARHCLGSPVYVTQEDLDMSFWGDNLHRDVVAADHQTGNLVVERLQNSPSCAIVVAVAVLLFH